MPVYTSRWRVARHWHLVFDNAQHLHTTGIAHDAAVAGGVVQVNGQQRQVIATAGVNQGLRGAGFDQGVSPLRIKVTPSSGNTGTACCTAWPVPN